MTTAPEPIRFSFKTQFGFAYVCGLLAVALAAGAFLLGIDGPWKLTRVVHTTVLTAPHSIADLQHALGQPQGQTTIQGHSCFVWQVGGSYILGCP